MNQENYNYKQIIEALLFAADEPLLYKEISSAVEDLKEDQLTDIIDQLNAEYIEQRRTFRINKIAKGYQMVTISELYPYLSKLFNSRKKGKLSKAALETLAIVAYKQPVTKAEVEAIRGVTVDMAPLLEKELIKILGRKDVPGKPIIYGTADKFLQYFGLPDIKDLPDFKEFVVTAEEESQKLEVIS
ncbi:SMC-Scp complex subunit ScpB [bacterium]|nr:SMC-Scp complex subunit ScpB [bacterium]